MLKKIKYSATLLILSVYFIGMILSFSGNLITQIQNIRYQNQIEKTDHSEILEFSIIDWNNFSDNEEITFQNNFYDVVSFKKINNKIFAKVVKDDFENEIRINISRMFKNAKSPISEKKKNNSFSKHLCSENNFYDENKIKFLSTIFPKFDVISIAKTLKFINFQEKPPC